MKCLLLNSLSLSVVMMPCNQQCMRFTNTGSCAPVCPLVRQVDWYYCYIFFAYEEIMSQRGQMSCSNHIFSRTRKTLPKRKDFVTQQNGDMGRWKQCPLLPDFPEVLPAARLQGRCPGRGVPWCSSLPSSHEHLEVPVFPKLVATLHFLSLFVIY